MRAFPSQAPHVLDDGGDLLLGEHRPERRHAAAALALDAVLGTDDRAVLDEVDHVLLVGEVGVDGAAGEVPAERSLAGHARVAPTPPLGVAAGAAERAAR